MDKFQEVGFVRQPALVTRYQYFDDILTNT